MNGPHFQGWTVSMFQRYDFILCSYGTIRACPRRHLSLPRPSSSLSLSVAEDLFTAEEVLTQEDYLASQVNCSFVMLKLNWDSTLQDPTKVIAIHHAPTENRCLRSRSPLPYGRYWMATSPEGSLSQENGLFIDDARTIFNLAFMFTRGNMDTSVFVHLIKAGLLAHSVLHYVFQATALFSAIRKCCM